MWDQLDGILQRCEQEEIVEEFESKVDEIAKYLCLFAPELTDEQVRIVQITAFLSLIRYPEKCELFLPPMALKPHDRLFENSRRCRQCRYQIPEQFSRCPACALTEQFGASFIPSFIDYRAAAFLSDQEDPLSDPFPA